MEYCNKCGKKLNFDDTFCPKCGNKIKKIDTDTEKENSKKIVCSHCGSDNVQVQIVSNTQNTGCLMSIVYIFLALTLVGIPIMILILLLKGKKTTNTKYYVCQNCGKTFNPLLNFKNKNRKNNIAIIIVITIILVVGALLIAIPIALEDKDYVEIEQYNELDVQALHNDYLDNEISAKDKYENNYYYFSGEIDDITEFLNDKYLQIKYTSNRDESKKIELNAYFSSSDAFSNLKKGDTVKVYCKFKQRSIEDYFGTTSYSFHSCRLEESFNK